jgi:hypothetical protein
MLYIHNESICDLYVLINIILYKNSFFSQHFSLGLSPYFPFSPSVVWFVK